MNTDQTPAFTAQPEDGDMKIAPSPYKPGKFELQVFTVGYRRGGEWSYAGIFDTIEEAKQAAADADYSAPLTIEG